MNFRASYLVALETKRVRKEASGSALLTTCSPAIIVSLCVVMGAGVAHGTQSFEHKSGHRGYFSVVSVAGGLPAHVQIHLLKAGYAYKNMGVGTSFSMSRVYRELGDDIVTLLPVYFYAIPYWSDRAVPGGIDLTSKVFCIYFGGSYWSTDANALIFPLRPEAHGATFLDFGVSFTYGLLELGAGWLNWTTNRVQADGYLGFPSAEEIGDHFYLSAGLNAGGWFPIAPRRAARD